MPDDKHSSPRTPTPVSGPQSPSTHLKRKERPDDDGKHNLQVPDDNSASSSSATNSAHPDEYEAGFITCQTCGTEVSFRDDNNGFTTKLWDAHRTTCSSSRTPASSAGPVMFASDSAVDALGHPPAKRRRAKRTEEERIEYLRSDPYVGQFEAYRVLCASCDKWIRLRPNSTYCSIPWDAHRKSCLAKKINNKNVYALEERNSLFSKDPDVRKFDPERLLCNICDKWLNLPPDDHLQAVQKWLQHRATCQRNATASCSNTRGPQDVQISESQRSPAISDHPPSPKRTVTSTPQRSSASPPTDATHPRYPPFSAPPPGSPAPFHALTPSNYGPAHESRRRNAEQRAANLREDPYIAEVEPNRVFCKLCQKWVQLRQDSSYCAYPWMQHRQKCEARQTQKAVEIAEMRARKQPLPPHSVNHEEDELISDREAVFASRRSVRGSEDVESEEGVESLAEDGGHRREMKSRTDQRHFLPASLSRHLYSPPQAPLHGHQPLYYGHPPHHYKSRSAPMSHGPSTSTSHKYVGGSMSQGISPMTSRQDRGYPHGRPHSHSISHPPRGHCHVPRPVIGRQLSMDDDIDADAEGEADMDADSRDAERNYIYGGAKNGNPAITSGANSSRAVNMTRPLPRRPLPMGLADLDSTTGRKQFISASVEYLFSSTYESTDDMSISALLAYLNAAMPPDKHEDFDTTEVVRAVASMKEKGKVVFEGDILRLVD